MIIGTLKEKKKFENRVAISPDEVKSYLKSGHQVLIEKGAGSLSGFTDKSYKEAGATITNSKEVLKTSEIIIKINCPSPEESKLINNKAMVVSQISTQNNQESIKILNYQKSVCICFRVSPKNNACSRYGYLILTSKLSWISCSN